MQAYLLLIVIYGIMALSSPIQFPTGIQSPIGILFPTGIQSPNGTLSPTGILPPIVVLQNIESIAVAESEGLVVRFGPIDDSEYPKGGIDRAALEAIIIVLIIAVSLIVALYLLRKWRPTSQFFGRRTDRSIPVYVHPPPTSWTGTRLSLKRGLSSVATNTRQMVQAHPMSTHVSHPPRAIIKPLSREVPVARGSGQ